VLVRLPSQAAQAVADLLDGPGEMRERMRAHDWSTSPLGPPCTWPQSLRVFTRMMLNAKQPMFIAWGPELAFLYNDAYVPIFGAKHPGALGRPFAEVWSDIWDQISPIVQRTLAGEGSWHEDLMIPMQRHGYREDAWFSFSYTPVHDESGAIAGMFCAATETTGKVLTERQKLAERDRLQQMFEQAPGIVAMLRGPDHVFEQANAAYYQLVGHRDLIGKSVREALPEIEGQGFFELLDDVYRKGEPFVGRRVRVSLQREPGGPLEERFVDFVYQPIRDAEGVVGGIFVEGFDVTEARRVEEAMRESEERLRNLADNIPNGMVYQAVRDPDGTVRFTYVSQAVERLHGLSAEAVVADASLLDAQVLEDFRPVLQKVREEADADRHYVSVEIPMRLASGEVRWFQRSSAPRRLPNGEVVWDGVELDITERKQAEEALRQSEERHRAIIQATPECVKVVAADGRLLEMNPAGLAMIEASDPTAVFGASVFKVIAPEYRKEWWANHRRVCDGESISWEFDIVGLKGTRRRMETHAVPLVLGNGSVAQLAVTRDVTARKRAEEQQRLLINELNHRVKNTLATVQSIATQSLRGADSTEQARASLEARLLALSRAHDVLTRENWEGAGLREIVAQATIPYDSSGAQRLSFSGPDVRLPPHMALAIAMVLQELATNAVKYGALSNATGRVDIEWRLDRYEAPPRLRLEWREQGGPPVAEPKRRGFGSRLIERSLAQDLAGQVTIEFAASGVVCTMDVPLQTF